MQNIYGISFKRLTAAGRGEFNPVTGNETVEGKARARTWIRFVELPDM